MAHRSWSSAPGRPASSWRGRSASWRSGACEASSAPSTRRRSASCSSTPVPCRWRPSVTRLADDASKALEEAGVELQLGARVVNVDPGGVDIAENDGGSRRVEAHTVLWAAGVQASPLAAQLAKATGAELDRSGRIEVLPDLSLPGHPEVFVLGDMTSLDHLPGVAEVAMQGGLHAANSILRGLEGEDVRPFRYRDLGSVATIGRFRAVASIRKLHLHGFPAWVVWFFVHLAFLTGFGDRFSTMLRWLRSMVGRSRAEREFSTAHTRWRPEPAPGGARHRPTFTVPEPPHLWRPSVTDHYDVVIIGSGAGGGTLAWKLAPTGKRILLLERGDYLPRERDNWDTEAVFLRSKYTTTETWVDADGDEFTPEQNYYVGGNTKFYGAALFRLRPEDFGVITPPRWRLAGVAVGLRRLRAVVRRRRGRCTWCTAPPARTRPTAPAAATTPTPRFSTSPGSNSSATTWRSSACTRRTCPIGVMLDQDDRRQRRAHEHLHPVRPRRRLPVPGGRQGRRADRRGRSRAGAPQPRARAQRQGGAARDRRGRDAPSPRWWRSSPTAPRPASRATWSWCRAAR